MSRITMCLEGNTEGKVLASFDLDEFANKVRADAIDELETELIDIILGNEEFTDWQKQEISLCLECVIEQLKEQNNV